MRTRDKRALRTAAEAQKWVALEPDDDAIDDSADEETENQESQDDHTDT